MMIALFVSWAMIGLAWCALIRGEVDSVEKPRKFKACPVKACGANQTSEIDSWECFGRHLFRPTSNPLQEQYVEHDCGGVGWGNSIRALYNAFAIAAVLDRRIIIRYWPNKNPFWRLWNPPYEAGEWDYGLDKLREEQLAIPEHMRGRAWHFGSQQYNDNWDYEKYGRSPGRFQKWVKQLGKSKDKQAEYKRTVLNTAICGAEQEFFTDGNCITKAFPLFEKCLTHESHPHLPDPILHAPFFYSVFSRPSDLLIEKLNLIRDRLSLPRLEEGYEPVPGSWGLQTPGYYIFALHFRRVPLGFEPLSVELSQDRNLDWRLSVLKAFWKVAVSNARQAKRIAKCRNETLLIYFATDNIEHLRPEAEKYLSKFGRVVFGLDDREVGHISAQWTRQSIESVQDRAVEMYKQGKIGVGSNSILDKSSLPSARQAAEVGVSGSSVTSTDDEPQLADIIVDVDTNDESSEKHALMALVEWWILGNANWLQSHSGTSYSDTSAGWGLGPSGRMERLDIVYGEDSYSSVFRRDWKNDICRQVGAADLNQAKKCPNERAGYNK